MPVKKIEKQELLHRCWEVFNRHGYHGTSVSMLAEATGLGKSGLMHHHLSKESLMRAVVEYAQETMRSTVFSVAQEDLPPEQRLEKLLRRQNRLVKMERQGCFFANTALETGRDGLFNEAIQSDLGRMEKSSGGPSEYHHATGRSRKYSLPPACSNMKAPLSCTKSAMMRNTWSSLWPGRWRFLAKLCSRNPDHATNLIIKTIGIIIKTILGLNLWSLLAPQTSCKDRSCKYSPNRPGHGSVTRSDSFLATARQLRREVAGQNIVEFHWGPEEAPLVLLSYGWAYNAGRWRHFVPELLEAGYRVLAYDPPGHGLASQSGTLNIPANAAIIRACSKHYGPAYAIVGHSFGGSSSVYAL
jgi:hypothetical protein